MTTRRLAAILAADVAGFSSMMERDEEGTFARVRGLQSEVIEPALSEHQGRLVKTTGDGFLAEFASPVQAVRAALTIQDRLASGGESDGPLRLRIGVNLGDIIIEESGDIYGDGVNVAARLEQMADPGGVLVSEDIQRQVAGKLDRSFEDRGEQHVKGITRPIRAFAIRGASAAPGTPKSLPLPDKPSVAVLPFTNIGGDPGDEFFADGVAEDIITALSYFRGLFVIARNSSFTYRGKGVDIRRIGEDLGVRYVLEGSVRRAGNRLRVTGQLVELASGRHLWADKLEGSANDVFDFQDQITERVVGAIQPSLWEAESERLRPRPTDSLTAYELYLRAAALLNRLTREGWLEAKSLLERATETDPKFGLAYAVAANAHGVPLLQGWSPNPERDASEAIRLARRALETANDDAEVLCRAAFALVTAGEPVDQSLAMLQRSLELNPNSAHAWQWLGWCLMYSGDYGAAQDAFERSRRLSPRDLRAFSTTCGLAFCAFYREEFEDAVRLSRQAIAQNPRFTSSWRILSAALAQAGKLEDAKEAVAQLRRLDPATNIRSISGRKVRSSRTDLYLQGLRKAGVPE